MTRNRFNHAFGLRVFGLGGAKLAAIFKTFLPLPVDRLAVEQAAGEVEKAVVVRVVVVHKEPPEPLRGVYALNGSVIEEIARVLGWFCPIIGVKPKVRWFMPIIAAHEPGAFCWPELYTTDQVGSKIFYVRLFGWELRDIPMGPHAVYTIFTLHGRDAAACYGALPDMAEQGIRPHWIAYVSVASSDETAAKAKAAGGKVIKEPFDVPGIGRMAVLQDPTGATICAWEARGHGGIGVYQEPGALQWTELLTNDTEAAAAFYQRVFGWRRQLWPSPEEPHYHLFMRGDAMAGGMTPITPEMGALKPVWVSYFRVTDCDEAVVKCSKLGGSISAPAESVPTVGRFAVLVDPAGAHFGIMQPA